MLSAFRPPKVQKFVNGGAFGARSNDKRQQSQGRFMSSVGINLIQKSRIDAVVSQDRASCKLKAHWTSSDGTENSGFLTKASMDPLYALKHYIKIGATDESALSFSEVYYDGKTYYREKSGYYLSQSAAPRLWLFLSTWSCATAWAIESSGRLVSDYDDGNPTYLCLKQPGIIGHSRGFLCTGKDPGGHFALLRFEVIK
jgi:hypothetical protein